MKLKIQMNSFRWISLIVIVYLVFFNFFLFVIVPHFNIRLPNIPFLKLGILAEDPGNGVTFSYHVSNDENFDEDAWVFDVDLDTGEVAVGAMETKRVIVFKAEKKLLNFLEARGAHKAPMNLIVPVSFYCSERIGDECDLEQPFTLYVANNEVELISIEKLENG